MHRVVRLANPFYILGKTDGILAKDASRRRQRFWIKGPGVVDT